jgi:PhnB protein
MPGTQLIPHLTVNDASAAIDFYTKAFGATELARHLVPNSSKIMHASMQIADNVFFLNDDFPEMCGGKSSTPQAFGGSPITLNLQVDDAQAMWDKAVASGATVEMPLALQFWGDKYGRLIDPFGQLWSICESVKKLSEAELKEASEAVFQA